MKKFYLSAAVVAASLALPGLPAMAQTNEIVIGITVTTTGPAAALGIPERNALEFVPKEIGGVPLKVIVLDDGGDPTNATTNARRFVTESKADIIMGSSTTPPSVAVSNVANEAGIPMGMTLADEERFARPDTSVAGQVLKLVAANPDAVLVGASGTAAGLPQAALRERGYKGLIYQTHGAASMDFIRIAGPAAEGVIMASGPVMNPEGQPHNALTKKPGLALNAAYEAKYGPNSRSQFAGHSYDAFEVLKRVIPVALKAGKPGTPEFREGIRQAWLTERDIVASQGVYNFTEKDRYGLDDRSRIILTVKNGKYVAAGE